MTDGVRIITIPRHNPVNAFSMGGISATPGSLKMNSVRCCNVGRITRVLERRVLGPLARPIPRLEPSVPSANKLAFWSAAQPPPR